MDLYLCIDLKCFYASVECVERNLDPMTTPLVVADKSRGKGTICLAISPYLKEKGVKNRCRLYEIPETMYYLIAQPRMKKYIEYSAKIYKIMLQYIAKEDIHIYSIDECFIDIKPYLHYYQKTPVQLGKMLIDEIYKQTKLIAACGIGTNLYLAKIALDLFAKKKKNRVFYLNEPLFKEKCWNHMPLSDFWQIGKNIEKRLNRLKIYTLKDLAFFDFKQLEIEFKSIAVELIKYAWGKDDTTISDIKNYQSINHSLSSGQVLEQDYSYKEAKIVLIEMVDLLVLDLIDKNYVTNGIGLSIHYSFHYSLKPFKVSKKLDVKTNLYSILKTEVLSLYDKVSYKNAPIRKINLHFFNLSSDLAEQYGLFVDEKSIQREKKLQKTINQIKIIYGKSAILKGTNLQKKATTLKRNKLIGGHHE